MTTRASGPPARKRPGPHRPRDAAATKQALVLAARELFGQRGFESTTIRDIGDRAGVDAALIARYFGGKADLYIAALVTEVQGDQPAPDFERLVDIANALVTRTDEHGLGPVTQALIRSDTSDDIRTSAKAHLAWRMVEPMVVELKRRGTDQPQLRAEVMVSALMGINLGRALGWFDDLQAVPRGQLVDVIAALLGGDPDPAP